MDVLEEYFSLNNMKLAWARMINSNGRDVKDFFGIQVYSKNLDRKLQALSDSLISGKHRFSRPFKYYEPKASRTHRTKTVLYVEDALVYQAIANKIAEKNFHTTLLYSHCVFSYVLHSEVQYGESLLEELNPEYYFFEFYVPQYNQFLNSINEQVNTDFIKFKLETDITGFFDSIPHSKLLLILKKQFEVPDVILNLLGNALNFWSGTRESLTPGMGIPQGAAPSFFFANALLTDLDSVMCISEFTYYRYMDDIRIYARDEDTLVKALVLIDRNLKGCGLSLNAKKTSIQIIPKEDKKEQMQQLDDYDLPESSADQHSFKKRAFVLRKILSENSNTDLDDQNIPIAGENLSDYELVEMCLNEIEATQRKLVKLYNSINRPIELNLFLDDDNLKREFINYAYRWRTALTILKEFKINPNVNDDLINIWLFGLKHLFWKANHFCWNLNQFGSSDYIKSRLWKLFKSFKYFEWVQYQILSNMASVQNFDQKELEKMVANIPSESSVLVRLGYYKVVFNHLKNDNELFEKVNEIVLREKEIYVRHVLLINDYKEGLQINSDITKNWLGL